MASDNAEHREIRFVRPFLPPAEELVADFQRIIDSGWLTKGPYLEEYERAAAEATGADYALGVASCTTGLLLLLMGLEKPGEVILPSFSFVATVLPVVWNGLERCSWTATPTVSTLTRRGSKRPSLPGREPSWRRTCTGIR